MLNPEAPEYFPVSTFFPVSPSPNILPFPPPYIPIGIPFQTGTTDFPFLPPHDDGFLSLPPPPENIPPSSDQPEFFPRVITGRKFIPSSCIWRGGSCAEDKRSGRSRSSFDDSGRKDISVMEGGYNRKFSRSYNNNERWDVNKHEMLPLNRDEEKTTVMIKNIPYQFTRLKLVEFLDKHCMGENQKAKEGISSEEDGLSAYDFLYLPIDFDTKQNKGYAFVNFTESRAVWKFFDAFNDTKWDTKVVSPKIIQIVCARIQGKDALVKHFERSYFECESDEFLPACFAPPRDGSGNEVEVTKVGRRRRISSGSTH